MLKGIPTLGQKDDGTNTAESIIGEDDRTTIDNPKSVAARPVCMLEFRFAGYPDATNYGTGTLIAPRIILTAAHNVFSLKKNAKIQYARVHAGVSNGVPSATSVVRSFKFPSNYRKKNPNSSSRFAYDYAVLLLDDLNVSNWVGSHWHLNQMPILTTKEIKSVRANVLGYPVRRQSKTGDRVLHTDIGKIFSVDQSKKMVFYKMDTGSGQSGGPVCQFIKSSNDITLIGIHVAGYRGKKNGARLFTPRMRELVNKYSRELLDKYPIATNA